MSKGYILNNYLYFYELIERKRVGWYPSVGNSKEFRVLLSHTTGYGGG